MKKLQILLILILSIISGGCDSPTVTFSKKKPFIVSAIEKVDTSQNTYISMDSATNTTQIIAPKGFNIGDTLILVKKPLPIRIIKKITKQF